MVDEEGITLPSPATSSIEGIGTSRAQYSHGLRPSPDLPRPLLDMLEYVNSRLEAAMVELAEVRNEVHSLNNKLHKIGLVMAIVSEKLAEVPLMTFT